MDHALYPLHARDSLLFSAIFSLAFAVPAAAQKIGTVPVVAPAPGAPRGKVLEWTSAEGKPFWYRLPAKLDGRNPPNLVFLLHGTGLKWGWAFWNYPIANGQFRGGDIVVAPEGMTPGQGDTFNFVQGKKDGDQIAGLIKLFRGRFPVDNVYIYGHSQGAFFCYWFAGAYTELVDGIVAHAGNVLQVKHHKLAREKVAIGILHGKEDAVVPVDCAHRTYDIYKKEGYRKLKLNIVEGLTRQSGHWPLPKQVSEMFEWLDQVSVDTPSGGLDVALSELAKKEPALSVVTTAIASTGTLLRNYRGKDRNELRSRFELLRGFVDDALAAHAADIKDGSRGSESNRYESWMAHFTSVHPAFAASRKWQSALRKLIQSAIKQDRLVAQVTKFLDANPGRASFFQATKVIEKALLAPDADGLMKFLDRLSEEPPPGVTDKDVERYKQAIGGRAELMEKGEKKAAAITARVAAEFRKKHPELFAGDGSSS